MNHRTRGNLTVRRLAVTAAAASLAVVGTGAPALASHTHVLELGNGQCAILAAEGGEKDVALPHAVGFAADRRHPLHVNVHLGEPGTRGDQPVIWVEGSPGDLANCSGYVND